MKMIRFFFLFIIGLNLLALPLPTLALSCCVKTSAGGVAECRSTAETTCDTGFVFHSEGCNETLCPAGGVDPKRDPNCPPDAPKDAVCLKNPLQSSVTAPQIISKIIKTALGIVGAITLLMIVWGGIQWLTSAGNAERVEAGTKTMIWAVVGLFLVFASYIIIQAIISSITTAPR